MQDPGEDREPVLTAFYDLEVSPVSFDFSAFAILAEMEKVRRKCAELHIVILPAGDGGFRQDDTEYHVINKAWRLNNIVIPHLATMPLRPRLTVCAARSDAEEIERAGTGPIFPEGYHTSQPTSAFMWSHIAAASARGESIPSLHASEQARAYMGQWLQSHIGDRKPVTITLRESTHAAVRNSNFDAWLEFARRLDTDIYHPIFVRDTEKLFGDETDELMEFTTCSLASLNVDLRMALYELSWLNTMVPGGPTVLCWLNRNIPFLQFKIINEDWPSTTTSYITSQGLEKGGQLPHATPYQRLVWEPDDLDVIEREFSAMVDRLEADAPITELARDPENSEDPMEVALRLQMTGRFEEATAIYQDIVGKDPDNADAWHLLGVIAHQADRPEAAEKMILRAISLTGGQSNYFINLAAVLKKAERLDEAANCLWRAVAFAPNDAGAHADLAEVLAATSEGDKAKSAMLKALKLKPDSIDICERAGQLFHAAGDIEIAANLYRQALEFRDDAVQRRLKAKEHLPEIPVQTLKTA